MAPRQVWSREVESRAKLKKLELEAEIENRIKQLEDKVNASIQQIDKSIARLDESMGQMKDNYLKFEQLFPNSIEVALMTTMISGIYILEKGRGNKKN